jgi:hypothetical protein
MSKVFYDHLIVIDDVVVELDQYEIPSEDRAQLLANLDEILHHHILDTVLLHLPREHHEHFLDRLAREPHHPSLLDFVQEKTKIDIEHEIKATVEYVKKKVLKDIEDSLE